MRARCGYLLMLLGITSSAAAHLPGMGATEETVPAYRIMPTDARRAAQRGVVVITTVSALMSEAQDSAAASSLLAGVVIPDLSTLKQAGVAIAVGSDQFRRTSAEEATALYELDLLSAAELLLAWSVITPRMIFPDRRIASLADGYKASLLVLAHNPLLIPVPRIGIRLRMKKGVLLR